MVNRKLKFISRIITCGMIMIMAAGAGENVKAAAIGSGSADQPMADSGYYFTLATHGAAGDDFDVTTMRPKYIKGNTLVQGLQGDDDAIIIWAVGHESGGYHDFENCVDCSGGYTYKLYKYSNIYMVNFTYQNGLAYTGIAGQLTVEEENLIYGRFIPDYDNGQDY